MVLVLYVIVLLLLKFLHTFTVLALKKKPLYDIMIIRITLMLLSSLYLASSHKCGYRKNKRGGLCF